MNVAIMSDATVAEFSRLNLAHLSVTKLTTLKLRRGNKALGLVIEYSQRCRNSKHV